MDLIQLKKVMNNNCKFMITGEGDHVVERKANVLELGHEGCDGRVWAWDVVVCCCFACTQAVPPPLLDFPSWSARLYVNLDLNNIFKTFKKL
jgi:hypothetical protein